MTRFSCARTRLDAPSSSSSLVRTAVRLFAPPPRRRPQPPPQSCFSSFSALHESHVMRSIRVGSTSSSASRMNGRGKAQSDREPQKLVDRGGASPSLLSLHTENVAQQNVWRQLCPSPIHESQRARTATRTRTTRISAAACGTDASDVRLL